MSQTITISIADDHKLFRSGLIALIEDFDEFEVVNEAENGEQLIHMLKNHQMSDMVMVDIEMPVMDGPSTVKALRERYGKSIKILALSMHKEYHVVNEMLLLGANGFLSKDASSNQLQKAINDVYTHSFYLPDEVSRMLFGKHYKSIETPAELSEVEQQIVMAVCEQKTNAEIADNLNLSVNTINSYRSRILEKINASNTAGIVIYAIKNNLYKI